MQHLIIVRHAPTDANNNGIFMGHHDAPCSKAGLAAAEALGTSLQLEEDCRLFTSPLIRSRATLDSISSRTQKIADLRLIERALGEWEGRSEASVQREYPNAFSSDGTLDPLFTPPGGERADVFVGRVCDFLVDISEPQSHSGVLVVTHNGVIAVMRSLIEEKSLRECFAEVEPFLTPRNSEYDGRRLRAFLPKILEALHAGTYK